MASNSYDTWMKKVDELIGKRLGVKSDDLPDQLWKVWFDDGMTPEQAVNQAFENEDMDMELEE